MAFDELGMNGYLGSQLGSNQLNTTMFEEMQRQQMAAYHRQLAQQYQPPVDVQRAQPVIPKEDPLLVLLTED